MRIRYLLPLVGMLALAACKDEKKPRTPRLASSRRPPPRRRRTPRLLRDDQPRTGNKP